MVSRAGDSLQLVAIAVPDATEEHPEAVFDVTLSLTNPTNSVEKFKIPDRAWDRMWKSSNRKVTWDAWNSDDSNEITVEIAPHDTYVCPDALKMYVDESVKAPRVDFRMGFRTSSLGKTFWSAPITLDVTP